MAVVRAVGRSAVQHNVALGADLDSHRQAGARQVEVANLVRRQRRVEDRHLINAPVEEVAGRVEDAASADVEATVTDIIGVRQEVRPGDGWQTVGVHGDGSGGTIAHHGHMRPFQVRERIGREVQAVVGPGFERVVIDVTELDQIVLPEDTSAVGLVGIAANPAGECKAGPAAHEPGQGRHGAAGAVELGGGVRVADQSAGHTQGDIGVGAIVAAGIIVSHGAAAFVEGPIGYRIVAEH